ncbi:MAG TPA: hypothetical protein VF596_07800 [Pyrinomonadaceae bacterium]|jgi:hypothetical protein
MTLFKQEMCISKKAMKHLLFVSVLAVTLFTSIVLYEVAVRKFPFLTTSSSSGIYTVNLIGRKERPFIFSTNEVRFEVLKNKGILVSDQYLHSGDFMDTSFDKAYPKHKWVEDNILRFYSEDYLSKGDTIVVINKTNKVIKYLKIFSTDKFLLFDVQPLSETKLLVSAPGGDFREMYIEGEYSNGLSFQKGESFSILKEQNSPFSYLIYINDTDITAKRVLAKH